MEAKLKESYEYPTAQLLTGREFVKSEWRPVPAGMEKQAQKCELLDVREPEPEPEVMVKPVFVKELNQKAEPKPAPVNVRHGGKHG